VIVRFFHSSDGVPRWHLVYFALAAFDLVTILLSLALTHNLMNIHAGSVETNKEWAARVGSMTELAEYAQNVNAPGNDIFDTGDVRGERARRDVAMESFEAHLTAVRTELQANVEPSRRAPIMAQLDAVAGSMTEMNAAADSIFARFAVGDARGAGRRMATMDRSYGVVTSAISGAVYAAQREQAAQLDNQLAAAQTLKRWEYVIGGLIIVMVLGVTVYGHNIGRVMRRHAEALNTARLQAEDLYQQQHALRVEAEEANRAKSLFLANVSHELRTPLNAIIGYSEIVAEDLAGPARTAEMADVQRVRAAADHLLLLIDDLLDIGKLDAGRFEIVYENVDLLAVCREAIDQVTPAAQRNGNSIELHLEDAPAAIRADRARLRQCLLNLLSNAVKFTKDGTVTLTAKICEHNDVTALRLEVADTGIGMSPQTVDRLFQPFAHADGSIAGRFGGTGLGLAITRRLVEAMEGGIVVDSEAGVGTRFAIILPLRDAALAAAA
jgi:signal transduction histidine kinase